MEKDDSDPADIISQSSPVKFIIMDSQYESEDLDILHLPLLQKSEIQTKKESDLFARVTEDTDSDYQTSRIKHKNVNVLVSDSEYDVQCKPVKKDAANSSSESIVIGESEDQMEVTVIERKERVDAHKMVEKDVDYKSDSGSSFKSNSRENLGQYNTAEISHSQGAKVRGHLFPQIVDTSEDDLFQDDKEVVSTPSDHIGSLQFSAQPMIVPETVEGEIFALSPSQDNFPHVIPNSPTSDTDCDPTAEQTLSDHKDDINKTLVISSSQKDKTRTQTQESFRLHLSCTESGSSQKQVKEDSVHPVDMSHDVITISQDEEEQEMDLGQSEEFDLHLSPSQSTERLSKSTDSKSLSEGNEGTCFHIKVPRDMSSQKTTNSQINKSQTVDKQSEASHSMLKSSHSLALKEEDMETQTPKNVHNQQKSVEIISIDEAHGGPQRASLKQTPSLTLEMITVESQVSEHRFNLDPPEIQVFEGEPSEDSRVDVFKKIKSCDKSSSRYIIQDDSDEEVNFKPQEENGSRPKLKMSRTMSSELTSTGYQASAESSSVLPRDTVTYQAVALKERITANSQGNTSANQGNKEPVADTEKTQSYEAEKYVSTVEDVKKVNNFATDKMDTAEEDKLKSRKKSTVASRSKKSQMLTFDNSAKTLEKTTEQIQPDLEKEKKTTSNDSKTVVFRTGKCLRKVDRNVRNYSKAKTTDKDQPQTVQTGAQIDPYEFIGSQSQNVGSGKPDTEENPLKYYKERKTGPLQETPPSSRKRKRVVHKKTGLKAAWKKTKPSKELSSEKHHVCFSSPVSESLTTPPSQTKPSLITSSSSQMGSKLGGLDLQNVPTRTGQQIISTFSPPRDRIEEDFLNVPIPIMLHREPIASRKQSTHLSTISEMRPPTSVPQAARSPSTSTAVVMTTTPSNSSMLTKVDTTPQQTDTHADMIQAGQVDIKLKTVTTTLVTYKTVETIEKVIYKNGTVQILSQFKERFPRPVKTETRTETTEEEYFESQISPSRTNSTVTSGDLGDVSSSLSRSGSSGPSSLEANRFTTEVAVSQTSDSSRTRTSTDKGPVFPSPKDTHHASEIYSPLDVSSIHKTSDRRLSSENLFTSPDTSKGEEEVKKSESSGLSDVIPCAQRKVVDPVLRSGEESEPTFLLPKPTTTESSGESKEISPEIPYQVQAVSTTKPDKQAELSTQKDGITDSRVMAKWKDSHFYPGVIKEVIGKSRYKVQFDDGDVLVIRGCDILLIDRLPVGQPVMVLSKDGYFYPGIITHEMKKGDVIQYTVDQDNGKSGKFRYSQVILSEDQAACLIADLHCQLGEPSEDSEETNVKNPDVSLENLVIGKRKKQSRFDQHDTSTGSQDDQKPGTSSIKKRKTFSPTPSRKKVSGPATSTPRVAKRRKDGEESASESTPPTCAGTSPIKPRRSPRKGVFASKQQKLFEGMCFMLTHVDKTPESVAIEKEILRDSSLETSAEEYSHQDEDQIAFDKDFLKKKIRSEGGVIIDKIDGSSKLKSPIFLISDSYHRTVKYFQSLAAGLPCVSHLWIRDSVHQHKLLDYRSYILQAGISFQKKKVMEWNSRRGGLKHMTVMVESESDKMKEEWCNILNIAEVIVVDKLHSKKATDGIVQVLVTDNSCKPHLLKTAKSLNVPIVSTEWIIQCLVNGQVVDFTGHPRYHYDNDLIVM